jgi:hypothetical protein
MILSSATDGFGIRLLAGTGMKPSHLLTTWVYDGMLQAGDLGTFDRRGDRAVEGARLEIVRQVCSELFSYHVSG